DLPLELLAERRRVIAEIVLAEFVLTPRRALGVLPCPTKPPPAGVGHFKMSGQARSPKICGKRAGPQPAKICRKRAGPQPGEQSFESDYVNPVSCKLSTRSRSRAVPS